MPKRSVKRDDYLWCDACECAVPKSKAEKQSDLFSADDGGMICPHCGEELVEMEADDGAKKKE